MKNFKYATLAALLLSTMVAGCNGWNPFRKKPVAAEPPLADIATIDNTGMGGDLVRPDPVVDPPVVVKDDPIPPVAPAAGSATTYTVQKIDKGGFYAIARRELGDPRRWKEIQALNPSVDPTKLRVGQTIKLPPK